MSKTTPIHAGGRFLRTALAQIFGCYAFEPRFNTNTKYHLKRKSEIMREKNKSPLVPAAIAALCLCFALTPNAADRKHLGGPKGGRLLEKTEPKAEFYLEQDRTATITFYDATLKPVPAADQQVTIIVEAKGGKKAVEFEKKGDVLVSKTKLPEGENYNLVVQFRPTADAKPQNFRFKLETHECRGCRRAEYACTCDE